MSATIEQEQHELANQELALEQAESFDADQVQEEDSNKENQGQGFRPRSSKTPEEIEAQKEIDSRSVYVGNVDYKATPEELDEFFRTSGTINRVTILYDRFTGYPKGYAYVEFESKESVESAIQLSGTDFKNRTISVVAKRTNLPGYRRGRGGYRGRGVGGRSLRGRVGGFRARSNRAGRGRSLLDIDPTTTAHEASAE